MFVYLLTNKVNGKYYVGRTVSKNLKRYLCCKKSNAKTGKRTHGMPIINAIAKYGFENFYIDILAEPKTVEDLDNLERLWIILLDSRNPKLGYNVQAGGTKGFLGRTMPDEAKLKIGAANKGKKPKGYIRTEEHRQQLRERMLGNKIGRKITSEIVTQWKANENPEDRAEWSRKGAFACHKVRKLKKDLQKEGM